MKNRLISILAALQILVLSSSAFAQTQGPAVPSFSQALAKMLPMFVMVFMIFYLMVLKPQQKKLLDQQKLLESLQKGNTVITTSGIIARVASVEKDYILLEVASNVKVKFDRSHIAKLYEQSEEAKAA